MKFPNSLKSWLTLAILLLILISGSCCECVLAEKVGNNTTQQNISSPILLGVDDQASQALPSWNDGPAKKAIIEFIHNATTAGPNFVKLEDRIATFDNDGTLWCEQPFIVQFDFIIRRWASMAESNTSKRNIQPYKAAVEKDMKWFQENHSQDVLRGLSEAFVGMTSDDYEKMVRNFFAEARHPRFGVPYQQVSYKPMRELIDLLKANGFRVFIVSGGGRDFMRVISEETYGIYKDRVVGTAPEHKYVNGRIVNGPKLLGAFDIGPEKVVHIFDYIGRMPVLAGGNGDVDIEMLESARFALLVNHDDAKREYAYDKGAKKALAVAKNKNWTVVSMKNDWKAVFPQVTGNMTSPVN